MRIPDIFDPALAALRDAGHRLGDLTTPTLRLGVTGLARAGKTVFITALVRNLIAGGRLPFFAPAAQGRLGRAYLEPQPDDAMPRFAYEEHIARLSADPPQWPDGTRRVSQLRVTIPYISQARLKRAFGNTRLHLDIVDYPGEWLLDLALLDVNFAAWSRQTLDIARAQDRRSAAAPFLAFIDALSPSAMADEPTAITGARLYTAYANAARSGDGALSLVGPGRFLLPGELEGSPALTFFPLPRPDDDEPKRGTLAAMLAKRFDSYKTHVVQPFFRDHFARIDRQIVLVDTMSALNAGPAALARLEVTLESILKAFRPGAGSWLSSILSRRIDRILLAATKADHVHHESHDRIEAVLAHITRNAAARASFAGASIDVLALAAIRATREAEARQSGRSVPVILGTPLPGEHIAGETFDGRREAGVFPGDVPSDIEAGAPSQVNFVRFRPPRLAPDGPAGEMAVLPNIRLDRALQFLLGDRLA